MFHQGDLQSGITKAIQEGKIVLCFVRDDASECRTWEEEYLTKQPLSDLIIAKSVVLRIELGSQEASFLSAFCPVTKAPTLAIINNGQLREVLMSPLSYDDFHSRLLRAIDPEKATTKIIPATEPSQASSAAETGSQSDAPVQEPTASATSNTSTEPQNPPPSSSQQSSNVQNLLQERRIRLEAEHKAREEKEKAERAAKAKARREAADAAAAGQSSGSKPAEADYAARERKRKQEQRQERERVRQLVENDKVERKAREARRKEALAAERMEQAEFKPEEGTSSSASIPAGVCAVQVRLFDGTTVRTRFDSPATQTLVSVRAWIDSQLQSAEGVKPSSIPPYTFKHILAPRPSRTIEVGEEEQTLHDLDLTPTATLVLVPVQGYTDAYANSGALGWLTWLYGVVAGAFISILNVLRRILGMIGGTGAASPPQPAASTERPAQTQSESAEKDGSRPSAKMKTLKDTKDEKDEHQLYNGNQLNFEPRPEDNDKKDD